MWREKKKLTICINMRNKKKRRPVRHALCQLIIYMHKFAYAIYPCATPYEYVLDFKSHIMKRHRFNGSRVVRAVDRVAAMAFIWFSASIISVLTFARSMRRILPLFSISLHVLSENSKIHIYYWDRCLFDVALLPRFVVSCSCLRPSAVRPVYEYAMGCNDIGIFWYVICIFVVLFSEIMIWYANHHRLTNIKNPIKI